MAGGLGKRMFQSVIQTSGFHLVRIQIAVTQAYETIFVLAQIVPRSGFMAGASTSPCAIHPTLEFRRQIGMARSGAA